MPLKIPFDQLSFENIDWRCLEVCNNDSLSSNEDKLQALINLICTKIDWTLVDLKCLDTKKRNNPVDILNLIIDKLCDPITSSIKLYDLSKIELCGKDNTSYTYQECLSILDQCFPTLTLEAILQALVKRINAYSFIFSQVDARIKDLEAKFNQQQTLINDLTRKLNNCCP